MTARSCAFTAATAAAWPALTNGDTWTIEDVIGSFGAVASGYPKSEVRTNTGVVANNLNKPMTFTNGPTVDSSSDVTIMGTTATWTPPANSIVIAVCINSKATTPDIPTISGNSITWTQVRTDVLVGTGGNSYRQTVWVGATGSAPTNGTVVCDCGTNTQTGWFITAVAITGVPVTTNGMDAIRQNTYASGTSTALAGTLAALRDNGSTSIALGFQQRQANLTAPAGFTSVFANNHAVPALGAMLAYSPAADAGNAQTSYAQTITSNPWAVTMLEIVDDAGALMSITTPERHMIGGTTTDLEAQVTVELPSGVVGASGPFPGILVRRISSTSYWYAQLFTSGKTSHVVLNVGYVTAGVSTQLASIDTGLTTFTAVTRLSVRLTNLASGATWIRAKCWQSGSESEPAWPTLPTDASTTRVVNITDAATPASTALRTTAGSHGLIAQWNSSGTHGTETLVTFDNYTATNFTQAIISATGVSSTATGTAAVKGKNTISAVGRASTFAGGTAAVSSRATIAAAGASSTAVGAAVVTPGPRSIAALGHASSLAGGSALVTPGARSIVASGAASTYAGGTGSVIRIKPPDQFISAVGAASTLVLGTAVLSAVAHILAVGVSSSETGNGQVLPGRRSIAATGVTTTATGVADVHPAVYPIRAVGASSTQLGVASLSSRYVLLAVGASSTQTGVGVVVRISNNAGPLTAAEIADGASAIAAGPGATLAGSFPAAAAVQKGST